MTLPGFDVGSPTWTALRKWVEQEISSLHLQLEQPGLDQSATERLRGMIATYRVFLAHGTPRPEIKGSDTPY